MGSRLSGQVAAAIRAVFGAHGLPLPQASGRPGSRLTRAPADPAKVPPAVIARLYGITADVPKGNTQVHAAPVPPVSQAVAELQGNFFSPEHLAEFFETYVPAAPAADRRVARVVGPNNSSAKSESTEAALDIQYIMGVAPGVRTEFWSFDGNDFCGDLADWTAALVAAAADPVSGGGFPATHSLSYGWQGALVDLGCSDAHAEVVDDGLAAVAALGVTVVVASGDAGSGFRPTPVGKQPPPVLYPSWPASSPWVTAVRFACVLAVVVRGEARCSGSPAP